MWTRYLLNGLCCVLTALACASGSSPAPAPLDTDFSLGEQAIARKDWQGAIQHMELVTRREPNNADAWNYQGYAYRQMGDTDTAFKRYEVALRINPGHKEAREYLGEAYLMVGNLTKAEEQLQALNKLCWMPCEPYRELKEKIADYKRQHAQ